MAMNLKDFFSIDDVKFTISELELPYETIDIYKISQMEFKYPNESYQHYRFDSPKKMVLREKNRIGAAA